MGSEYMVLMRYSYKGITSISVYFKTIKERNMWTCAYYDGIDPITISLIVRPAESSDVIPISKIRIWNYNKSLTVSMQAFS